MLSMQLRSITGLVKRLARVALNKYPGYVRPLLHAQNVLDAKILSSMKGTLHLSIMARSLAPLHKSEDNSASLRKVIK